MLDVEGASHQPRPRTIAHPRTLCVDQGELASTLVDVADTAAGREAMMGSAKQMLGLYGAASTSSALFMAGALPDAGRRHYVVAGFVASEVGALADVAFAGSEALLVLAGSPGFEHGEGSLVDDDLVVGAGLAVGLHHDLVVDAGDGPDQSGGPGVEIEVLPAQAEVGAASIA